VIGRPNLSERVAAFSIWQLALGPSSAWSLLVQDWNG
jgi:hypothetical protein